MSDMLRLWRTIKDGPKYLAASMVIILVKRKLKRRPHDWTLWLTLARLYEIGCHWPKAIHALERARELNPHSQHLDQLLAKVRTASQQSPGRHIK